MRNIPPKVDGTDVLTGDEFNSDQSELENAVTSTDQTLDSDAGPDTDLNMLAKAMAAYGNAANVYQDSGAADAYVLAIASNLKPVTKYYDNMMIVFKAGNSNTGASTVNVNTLGVKDIEQPDGTALGAGDILTGKYVAAVYNLGADRFEIVRLASSGDTVQVVHTQDSAVATGSTQIPFDDTIPQNTEGDEYITLAITPKSATNKLLIESTIYISSNAAVIGNMIAALFQDSVVNSLAVATQNDAANSFMVELNIIYEMVAGTTSLTTFKIRAGYDAAGTSTLNGSGGVRKFGGVFYSSLRITEIQA